VNQIRVIIADDHMAVRAMLRQLLDSACEVVFETSNGSETVEAVERLQPELLLLDIAMPHMDGFEVLRQLKLQGSRTRIIMVSTFSDPAYIREASVLGAEAYLTKRRMARELLPCIQRLFA
jgi:DNA-binding NarL/FixJ family response regulator